MLFTLRYVIIKSTEYVLTFLHVVHFAAMAAAAVVCDACCACVGARMCACTDVQTSSWAWTIHTAGTAAVPPTVCPDVPAGYSVSPDTYAPGGAIAWGVLDPSTACNRDPDCLGYVYISEGGVNNNLGMAAKPGTGITKYYLGTPGPLKGVCLFVKLACKFIRTM